MKPITESNIKTFNIEILQSLSWEYINGLSIAPGAEQAERENFEQIILTVRLRKPLQYSIQASASSRVPVPMLRQMYGSVPSARQYWMNSSVPKVLGSSACQAMSSRRGRLAGVPRPRPGSGPARRARLPRRDPPRRCQRRRRHAARS